MKKIIYIILLFVFSGFFSIGINAQWIIQNSFTNNNILKVKFLNANTGFMTNNYWNLTQVIYKTTNSGVSWDSTTLGDAVNSIFFLNQNTGWLTGRTSADPGVGKVWKTTNGGNTWISQLLADSLNGSSIFFTDVNTGYLTANKTDISCHFLKTTNGGNNWNEIYNVMQNYRNVYNCYFINNNTGWLLVKTYGNVNGDSSFVLKTTDGGTSWLPYLFNNFFGYNHSYLHNIIFLNQNTGYISGNREVWYLGGVPEPLIFKTTDGGNIWLMQTPLGHPDMHYIEGMYFNNVNSGWIVGDRGIIQATVNGGSNWNIQPSGVSTRTSLRGIDFNTGNGWIVGDAGTILKTTNGGITPLYAVTGTVKYQDNNIHVTSGYVKAFKHSNTGDIIVEDSAVIQSDGSYTIHIPHDTTDLMAFQNDEVNSLNFVPTYYPSTIYWQNAGHIYTDTNMTGIDIGVYRITNNGLSPGKISGGVFKYTAQSSLLGVGSAVIYAKLGNNYKGFSISNISGAYIVDSLPHGFYQLICNRMGYPTQTKYIYLGNTNLTNINFYFGSQLTGIQEGNEIPDKFSLAQNYPNPFNPSTTFKFALPKSAFAKLTVYDLLGREVSVLVNEQLGAGNYKIEWNASNYSSGVYFYRIEAGDFNEVKKLVLIK